MKIRVLGASIYAVSAIKAEDFKYAHQYNPGLLTQHDEDGNAIFAVSQGNGGIARYGIGFNRETADGFMATQFDIGCGNKEIVEQIIKEKVTAIQAAKAFEVYFNEAVAGMRAAHEATVAEIEFVEVEG